VDKVVAICTYLHYTLIIVESFQLSTHTISIMKALSQKQKDIYQFVVTYSKDKGHAPSLKEVAGHFPSLKYPSSALYHIKILQDNGFLERELYKPRSIGLSVDKFVKSPVMQKHGLDSIKIPLMGSANAGAANIFAEENIEGYLKMSSNLLNKRDGIFALRIDGDSMNKAKINGKKLEDGNIVLIDSEYRNPKNGDYVLSIIDGMANLKKFVVEKSTNTIKLISESTKSYKPIYISSDDDYMINGRIIDVIKK